MKKALSICLLAILSCSTSFPVFAQQTKSSGRSAIKVRDAATRFANARALTDGNGVFLEWVMEREINNAGFYVYRSDYRGKQLVSPDFIGGSALRVGAYPTYGEKYTLFDADGDATANYTIESLHMSGKRTSFDVLVPALVEDLKEIAGTTSQEMSDFSKYRPSVITNIVSTTKEVAREIINLSLIHISEPTRPY